MDVKIFTDYFHNYEKKHFILQIENMRKMYNKQKNIATINDLMAMFEQTRDMKTIFMVQYEKTQNMETNKTQTIEININRRGVDQFTINIFPMKFNNLLESGTDIYQNNSNTVMKLTQSISSLKQIIPNIIFSASVLNKLRDFIKYKENIYKKLYLTKNNRKNMLITSIEKNIYYLYKSDFDQVFFPVGDRIITDDSDFAKFNNILFFLLCKIPEKDELKFLDETKTYDKPMWIEISKNYENNYRYK